MAQRRSRSAKDKTGRRLLVVINGLKDEKERAEEAERLLAYGFRDFEDVTILHKGDSLGNANVWFGTKPKVGLTVAEDVVLTLPKTARDKMKFTLSYDDPVQSPVAQGDHVADLKIESADAPAQVIPVVAAENVDSVHGFTRMVRTLKYYILRQ